MKLDLKKFLIILMLIVLMVAICVQWFAIWILWDIIEDIQRDIDNLRDRISFSESVLESHNLVSYIPQIHVLPGVNLEKYRSTLNQ